jgi:hypothetical protein
MTERRLCGGSRCFETHLHLSTLILEGLVVSLVSFSLVSNARHHFLSRCDHETRGKRLIAGQSEKSISTPELVRKKSWSKDGNTAVFSNASPE